ncbi:MAG: hypothetical protein EYC62_07685 [Alphaproteobacteria bacterium]|nr:MAG: hypothetical protein EYC62_07685 [Alphaproteobacteria bacterium]
MKLAGDLYLAGNSILLARGGVALNAYDIVAAALFFGAAGLFAVAGNDKFLARLAMGCGTAAMGTLWVGTKVLAKEGADSIMDQIGKGIYIFSQLFGIFAPGYTPSEEHRKAVIKLRDAIFAKPLRTVGALALISKLPMFVATVENLKPPEQRLGAAAFLCVLAAWIAADVATLCAGQLRNRTALMRGSR